VAGEEGFSFKGIGAGKFRFLNARNGSVARGDGVADSYAFILVAETTNVPTQEVKDTNFTRHW
jgi:hypothetical protein